MTSKQDDLKQFDFNKTNIEPDLEYAKLNSQHYWDDIKATYRDPATKYAIKVLSGQQIAGRKIRLAMFRHLNDLKRSQLDSFKYEYNLQAVRSIIRFSKLCPDVESGEPRPLLLWQDAILALINGWRSKKTDEKRFTFCYLSIGRTNGKTYLVNILLTYAYLIENQGKNNLDFAYVAPVEKSSKKGFRYLGSTLDYLGQNLAPFKHLIDEQSIAASADLIQSFSNKSQIIRLTAGSGKFDSLHATLSVLDEYGDPAYSDGVISRMSSGNVHQFNKQIIATSSAYENSNVPMYADYKRLSKVVSEDASRQSDDQLFLCWEQDSLDETSKPELWVKSNPLIDLPSMHDRLMAGLKAEKDRQEQAGRLTWFQNRNLNMWLKVSQSKFLELDDINKAISDVPFSIDNRDVYVGLDLSHLDDDSSLAFLFPYFEGDKQKVHIIQHSFVPTAHSQGSIEVKSKRDGINYQLAHDKGFASISQNEDGFIDDDQLASYFNEYVEQHNLNVKAFVYDAWTAKVLIDMLEAANPEIPFISLAQKVSSLDQPTRLLEKMFIRGLITFSDDPILTASLSNAIVWPTNAGIKIDKFAKSQKIDCVDAIVDALSESQYWYTDPNRNEPEKTAKHPFKGQSDEAVSDYFINNFGF
ncbi:terminase TerL endonuclease subunit [Lactiplantibacillus plantarum]|uniref:terminase TerL endonuclease subunit n=1 Tax=Lactiplantibacillus plantarum TaxID=1590 RepID=UPI0007B55F9C|nr:terminase TerL endonuclease subunit [Lactiplantibacillus plantarum]KZU46690.1 Phage terminase large subunit [Lactiplantibacillus plantarum]KZU48498.1 Phage terminase large subunit [Lactiplantibacillus plantarum]